MKTQTKTCGLWAVILLGSALAASAIQVTYQVDMSVQIALGNFIPGNGDAVFLNGNFTSPGEYTTTDGSTNYILHPSANPNIYTNTFNITNVPASFETHRFVINPNGDYLSPLIYETMIIGGAPRNFEVPTVATNLPVVFFNDVSDPNDLVSVPVTFYVDMSVQQTLGNFNPANDFVIVAGDWMGSDWATALNSAPTMTQTSTNTHVYQGTITITSITNSYVNYKFVLVSQNNGTTWEGNVGPIGADNLPSNNRQFLFLGVATDIPTVYFNNASNANVSVQVGFQVNLLVEHAIGVFSPGDTVYVAGDFTHWATAQIAMIPNPNDPNTYNLTSTITGYSPGTVVNYKYVGPTTIGNGGWENNGVGPNNAQNRQIIIPNLASTNIPGEYFNNLVNLGRLTVTNSSGQAVFKWPIPGNFIRLQSSTNLNSGWLDISSTYTNSSTTQAISGSKFFRVKGL